VLPPPIREFPDEFPDRGRPQFVARETIAFGHEGPTGHAVIPPGGNGTFEVLFIPSAVAAMEQTIFMFYQSYDGGSPQTYKYQVMGDAIESPFRISPFVGAKIPLNSSYEPLLRIHNPESTPMQIISLYTTGSKVQFQPLTLADDQYKPETEDLFPKESFLIYPFEEKTLGHLTVMGIETGFQEAFVRIEYIHVGSDNSIKKKLVIPVEVEVKDTVGLYAKDPILDFGIIREEDVKKTIPVNIINSGKNAREVDIDWVRPLTNNYDHSPTTFGKSTENYKVANHGRVGKSDSLLKIHWRQNAGVKLEPNTDKPHNIANLTLTFDARQVERNSIRELNGKIKVHVKNSGFQTNKKYDDLVIPWRARLLHGSLDIDETDRRFIMTEMREDWQTYKDIHVHNTLAMPVILYKVPFNHTI